jgi:hypothetical protein
MTEEGDFFIWPNSKDVEQTVCLTDKTAALLLDFMGLELKQQALVNDWCATREVNAKKVYQQQCEANEQAMQLAALFLIDNAELKFALESLERPLLVPRLATVGGLAGLYEKVKQGRLTREEFFILMDRVRQRAQEKLFSSGSGRQRKPGYRRSLS